MKNLSTSIKMIPKPLEEKTRKEKRYNGVSDTERHLRRLMQQKHKNGMAQEEKRAEN